MGIKSFNNPKSKYNAVWGQTGLDAVNPSPVAPDYIEASGGTETTYAPSPTVKYKVHSFLGPSPATFVVDTAPGASPTIPTTIDILVVGGGGGSGARNYGGAGGGAGGMAVATSYAVVAGTTYPITVGAGGEGTTYPSPGATGANGGDSIFTNPVNSPYTITGKGGGGAGATADGNPGGSGGGGCGTDSGYPPPSDLFTGGEGIQPTQNPGIPNLTNYGNDGGTGGGTPGGSDTRGGAGGGAGASGGGFPGGDPSPGIAGANGQPNDFRTGAAVVYGGGGGACGHTWTGSNAYKPGGTGGGGASSPKTGTPGTANTGGGGGGSDDDPGGPPVVGGDGGSGIVVVRYLIDPAA